MILHRRATSGVPEIHMEAQVPESGDADGRECLRLVCSSPMRFEDREIPELLDLLKRAFPHHFTEQA